MTVCLGVDPGVRGGIAVLQHRQEGARVLYTRAFTPGMTLQGNLQLVQAAAGLANAHGPVSCYIERVGHISGDGGQGSFTFGRVTGGLLVALYSCGLDPIEVPPVLWQSRLDCLSGGDKNVTKRKAQQLFPYEKITHSIADALLIAYYGLHHERE